MAKTDDKSTARKSVPWLGIVIVITTALVLVYLIQKVIPEQDGCTSDLIAQARGLDFGVENTVFKASAKVSPAAQNVLTERLQEYAQQTSFSCRMFKAGVLSVDEYRISIDQINKEIGALRSAASKGELASPTTTKADLSRVVYEALNQGPLGPYIVFFDWSRGEVTPEAKNIIENAAALCRRARSAGATFVANVQAYRALNSEFSFDPQHGGGKPPFLPAWNSGRSNGANFRNVGAFQETGEEFRIGPYDPQERPSVLVSPAPENADNITEQRFGTAVQPQDALPPTEPISPNRPSSPDALGASRLIAVVQVLKQSGCDVPATIDVAEPQAGSDLFGPMGEIINRRVEITFSPAVL